MIRSPSQTCAPQRSRAGFAIVVCVVVLMLLALVSIGMLSLSTIEVRKGRAGRDQAIAKANARLAMMEAIGQLQRHLGPDQRVSAASSLVGDSGEQHWTGVW